MNKWIRHSVILLLIFTMIHACIKEPDIYPNDARGNFEALWEIIDTRYCYLDYKKIDWDAIYQEYSPKIDTVSNKYVLFDLMAEMLAELKDGHVNLYSSFDRSRYTQWYSDYPQNFNSSILYKERYLSNNYRIAGGLRYRALEAGTIGYIYYNSFSTGFSNANIREIFEQFKSCSGLIIDVRGNTGGQVNYSENLASYFFNKKTLTGYILHKTGKGHADFSKPEAIYTTPNENTHWDRPVVVLMNRLSYSATNDFICRMQYAPKAIRIGDTSGGGGGLPFSSELPNGWMIRFSASPALDAEKNNIEWGIVPDIHVYLSPEDEANGVDSIIEEAIKQIKSLLLK